MPDSSGSIDLAAPQQEQPEQPISESSEGQPTPLITAFLVLLHPDGNPEVRAFQDPGLDIKFAPTPDLIYGAAATLQKDMTGQEFAQASAYAVLGSMEARARQAMEAQQTQQVAQRLGDLKRV